MGVSAESLTFRGGRRTGAPPTGSRTTPPPPPLDAAPARARGVDLLGGFEGSGHRVSPYLVRRADGQMAQLTPVLYEVLNAIDGTRDYPEIARVVSERLGKLVVADDVRFLITEKLHPLGLLRGADGAEPVVRKANPLLALRFRAVVTNPKVTGAIAAVFSPLFSAPLVAAFTVCFFAIMGWLLLSHGVAGATRTALYEPQLLLLVFALTTLSAGFHELGHAAAARYSGARPGVMGVGLYLVWPAFYTDVTDSYRLDKRGRLRTDLGGIYFNAIFAVITYALWRATGSEALLIVIPLQGLQMLRQMVPLVRLDGYHILADITGVPDLFAHIKPILKSVLPWRWGRGDAKTLKPWVRVVVTAWVLLVIPILLATFALIAWTLPRILATAWDSAGQSWTAMTTQLAENEYAGATLSLLSIFALGIPALSTIYLVTRIARRTGTRVWRGTEGHPVRRGATVLAAVGLIAALVMAWWPRGQYTPIQSDERGTLVNITEQAPIVPGAAALGTTELASMSLPVMSDGALGAPSTYQLVELGDDAVLSTFVAVDERGRFPFPLPAPPGIGDNQALVVNTIDGSSMIDLALSLVFVGDPIVDNSNEAWALAACTKCSTVAIAYQVVIIVDNSYVVIPENIAAAVNANCAACLTHAIATQTIGTALEPLSDEVMAELRALWAELEELDRSVSRMTLQEVYTELDALQKEIETLLVDSGVITRSATGEDQATTVTSEDSTDTTAATTEEEAEVAEPAPTGTPSPSSTPTASSSPSSSPSPNPSP